MSNGNVRVGILVAVVGILVVVLERGSQIQQYFFVLSRACARIYLSKYLFVFII